MGIAETILCAQVAARYCEILVDVVFSTCRSLPGVVVDQVLLVAILCCLLVAIETETCIEAEWLDWAILHAKRMDRWDVGCYLLAIGKLSEYRVSLCHRCSKLIHL